MKKILLVIPAYNEEKTIVQLLENIQPYLTGEYEVLIIDDGSKDHTVEKVKEYGHGVTILSQIYNMGYGSSLQLGYKYALAHDFDYVMQMDADGQHDAKNIEKMRTIIEHEDAPDILIGSRFLSESQSFKIPIVKKIAIQIFRWMIKKSSGKKVTDPTSGLQCLNRKAFTYYAEFTNFDFQYPDANMIIQMCILGYRLEEFPAIMHSREFGTSMHEGIWKPFLYVIIMFIAIINVNLREKGKISQ